MLAGAGLNRGALTVPAAPLTAASEGAWGLNRRRPLLGVLSGEADAKVAFDPSDADLQIGDIGTEILQLAVHASEIFVDPSEPDARHPVGAPYRLRCVNCRRSRMT